MKKYIILLVTLVFCCNGCKYEKRVNKCVFSGVVKKADCLVVEDFYGESVTCRVILNNGQAFNTDHVSVGETIKRNRHGGKYCE